MDLPHQMIRRSGLTRKPRYGRGMLRLTVLELLAAQPWQTSGELADKANTHISSASRVLGRLRAEGEVIVDRYSRYALADERAPPPKPSDYS
jgi:DNA-binding MarR family transcriptional regulator